MSDNPLVSVIVPLFNYESYIRDCIESILNQNYPNFELIVVDDVSTDNSFEVASLYSDSDKVQIIKLPENSGYSKAKNEGILLSRGELITTLDADDMLTKKSISKRVKALQENPKCDLVHANAIDVGAQMSLADCYALKKFRRTKPKVHAQTVMLRREVHVKFGLYDENLRSRADKEMWSRLLGKSYAGESGGPMRIKKVYLNEDVAYYRKHKKSMIAKRKHDPQREKRLTKQLKAAIRMRATEGITKENTRFL
jgi:glycosyltransferase involved in cell wall biosynthesis